MPTKSRSESVEEGLRSLLPMELRRGALSRISASAFLSFAGLRRLTSAIRAEQASLECKAVLLELGPGASRLSEYLAATLGCRAITLDVENMRVVRRSLLDMVGDMHAIPISTNSIDIIIANDVLHLSEHPDDVLSECARVLRPRGLVFFSTYTARGSVPGGSRLLADWTPTLRKSPLSSFRMNDVTQEWRRIMRAKHAHRLENAASLLERFGQAVVPDLSVSASMIGSCGPGFLELVRRWEIFGRA